MIKEKIIGIIVAFLCAVNFITAQSNAYYLPFELPGHTSVKYNSFLLNPALPILKSEVEQHIALNYRNQWGGFQKEFYSAMLTYGKKWNNENMFHAGIFQKKASIFQNFGLLGNYVHQIEISDENYLRLGINGMFGMSGINASSVIVVQKDDPLVSSFSKTMVFNAQPAFDINFGVFHIGVMAENLLDYAISAGEMAVPFAEKAYTGHLMFDKELSSSGFLDEAKLSAMARVRKTADNIQFGGNVLLNAQIGWAYAGYDQKYGAFGGIGFNPNTTISVGFGYEQGIATFVEGLGSSFEVTVAYNFGGDRQARESKVKKAKAAKLAAIEQKKKQQEAAAKAKETPPTPPTVAKTPTATKTPTTQTAVATPKPPTTTRAKTPEEILEERMKVQVHKISNDKVAKGYYVVAGVYRNPKGAFQMMQNIRGLGLTASTFVNPENGMTYVYFNDPYATKGQAGVAMQELLKKPEFADRSLWVLRVE